MEIEGTTVLVTGAGGTIGGAVVRSFIRRGARVLASDRGPEGLERLRLSLGVDSDPSSLMTVVGDVSTVSHYEEVSDLAAPYGGLDVVVLNAAIYLPGLSWEISPEDWRLQMEVNFWGVLHGIRTVVPSMIDRGRGHVVAVSSGAGVVATPGLAPYVASKHAVIGLMETLRLELNRIAPEVGASVVCPGNVSSDMAGNSLAAAGIGDERLDERTAALAARIREGNAGGSGPEVVADAIIAAVGENRFWVVPHPEIGWVAVDRTERLRDGLEPADWLT